MLKPFFENQELQKKGSGIVTFVMLVLYLCKDLPTKSYFLAVWLGNN